MITFLTCLGIALFIAVALLVGAQYNNRVAELVMVLILLAATPWWYVTQLCKKYNPFKK